MSGQRAQDHHRNYLVLGPSRGLIPKHFNVRQREEMISQETQMNGDSKEGRAPERDY